MQKHKTIHEWLSYIENFHYQEIELGLDRVGKVFGLIKSVLGFDKIAKHVFVVAGTNGKGSTSAYIENFAFYNGFSVATYSSPHILSFNERLRVNLEDVTDNLWCDAFSLIEKVRGNISLTYFEYLTLASLIIIKQNNVDVAVLEVGLGGRLDAVNIVDADVAVITNIDLDHTEYLGDTLEKIFVEKAGILRDNTPFVFSSEVKPSNINEIISLKNAKSFLYNDDFCANFDGKQWNFKGKNLDGQQIELNGLSATKLPSINAPGALQAYILSGLSFTVDNLNKALSNAFLPARFQKLAIDYHGKQIDVYIDAAHNAHAARYLAKRLQAENKEFYAVFSVLKDKDLNAIVYAMKHNIDKWFIAPLSTNRMQDLSVIGNHLKKYEQNFDICSSIEDAATRACYEIKQSDKAIGLLFFGSFYVAEKAFKTLINEGYVQAINK